MPTFSLNGKIKISIRHLESQSPITVKAADGASLLPLPPLALVKPTRRKESSSGFLSGSPPTLLGSCPL